MRIQNPERLVLLLHVGDQSGQDDMLQDIREIASVIGVAIIHDCS